MANCTSCHYPLSNCHCDESEYRPQSLLVPIYEPTCDTGCGSVEGCPDTTGRLYGLTLPNFSITVPAVEGIFSIQLCVPNSVTVGQWVYIKGIGRFPVVSLTAGGRTVSLRNSCSNGLAIPGNQEPGYNKVGQHEIYLVQPADCDLGFCDEVKGCVEAVSKTNQFCFPNMPLLTDAQSAHLFGLTAACDPGDCPPQDDPSCWVKSPWHVFKKGTMTFVGGIAPLTEEDTEGGQCAIPLVALPNGEIRQGGGLSFYILRKSLITIQTGYGDVNNLINKLNNIAIDPTPFIPANHLGCLKAIAVSGWYGFDNDDNANEGIHARTYIRGQHEAAYNSDFQLIQINGRSNAAMADYGHVSGFAKAAVAVDPVTKRIVHDFQNVNTAGNTNAIDFYLKLDGYYI